MNVLFLHCPTNIGMYNFIYFSKFNKCELYLIAICISFYFVIFKYSWHIILISGVQQSNSTLIYLMM